MADTPTRDERKAQLEELNTKKDLIAAGAETGVTVDPDLKMAEMIDVILTAEYPVDTIEGGKPPVDNKIIPEGTPSVDKPEPVDPVPVDTGTASVDKPVSVQEELVTNTGTQSVTKEEPKVEEEAVDPLTAQYTEVDTTLGALYDGLVEKIKAVAVPGASVESADQLRAGAIQFLRQCNDTIEAARQLVFTCNAIIEQNNQQLQSIDRAKADLEQRSEDYRRMTTGGVKNEDANQG